MRDTGGDVVPLRSALKVWALVSLQSFGDPVALVIADRGWPILATART